MQQNVATGMKESRCLQHTATTACTSYAFLRAEKLTEAQCSRRHPLAACTHPAVTQCLLSETWGLHFLAGLKQCIGHWNSSSCKKLTGKLTGRAGSTCERATAARAKMLIRTLSSRLLPSWTFMITCTHRQACCCCWLLWHTPVLWMEHMCQP